MKVLVADDDLDQLTLRCLILEKNGFETIQARDSATALKLTRLEKPECAVVDLRFPTEESGLKLLRDLKALDQAIRLVLLTGVPCKSVPAQARDAADETVEKSSGTSALVSKLNGLLRVK
ncbi:MAG TPA: response regulator [Bryobacteraceae bacterium]|jgi:DNA-binding response OmpR family regulator|nr:response regulator [Bryobacteraceae bacterium]